MFCRNCGSQMDPKAVVCVKCGVPAGVGNSFCQNCGASTAPEATFCIRCGVMLTNKNSNTVDTQRKSKLVAGILGILLGALGVHNFYLGYTGKALAQLLISVLSCGILAVASAIWGLVEGIIILTSDNQVDANGVPLKD